MDDDEFLEDLIRKRDSANREAEFYRRERDIRNEDAKKWMEERDILNEKCRKLAETANAHREKRDFYNENVKVAKKEREKWEKICNDLVAKINFLKRKYAPRSGPPLWKLKKELKELEFKQMTSVLKPEDEKELMAKIAKLQSKINDIERRIEENEEVRRAKESLKIAIEEYETAKKKVEEAAELAGREHEKMVVLYEECDRIRASADKAQENFIKTKLSSDEFHRKHIELIRKVHDYDKMIGGIKKKKKRMKEMEEEMVMKKRAEDIYERFKQGEKLSTEDLMTLQKSGYI